MRTHSKTNVMRLLDEMGVDYTQGDFSALGAVSAVEAAHEMGVPEECVFKTLVTVGGSGGHFVFVIPGCEELDLKKAAKSVGEKSIAMVKSKELLGLTGYIHGGCSPIGMKKLFVTVVDETAQLWDRIYISAGKVGYNVGINYSDLEKIIPVTYSDLTV